MTDFAGLLSTLVNHRVEFLVVGGAAAIAHGSASLTQDLDIVYRRNSANLEKLSAGLSEHRPYLRGVPPGLPFLWDTKTLARGLNFTLTTSLGAIGLLGEIAPGHTYENLAAHAIELQVFEVRCLCLSLPQLIEAKRSAGRPKDLQIIAELEAIEDQSA